MEDDRFILFPRTQKGNVTWYCYIYDQNGNRKYRSTETSNKAKARDYVLKKYKDGTLFEFKTKEALFKDFVQPF